MKLSGNDRKRVREIRGRVNDLYRSHAHDIEKNNFLRVGARNFADMKYLLDLVEGVAPAPVAEALTDAAEDAEELETAEV